MLITENIYGLSIVCGPIPNLVTYSTGIPVYFAQQSILTSTDHAGWVKYIG